MEPNLHIQDGPKPRLFGRMCEARFSLWEKRAAESIFGPLHQDTATLFDYESWLLNFAVSVSFRTLFFHEEAVEQLKGSNKDLGLSSGPMTHRSLVGLLAQASDGQRLI